MSAPRKRPPEWWACYAAAYAVEQRMYVEHLGFDRARECRATIAERAATIADDAIAGLAEAEEGGAT